MGLNKGQKKGRAASEDHHFGEVSGLDCFGDFQWPLLFVWIKRGWWELSPSLFPEAVKGNHPSTQLDRLPHSTFGLWGIYGSLGAASSPMALDRGLGMGHSFSREFEGPVLTAHH